MKKILNIKKLRIQLNFFHNNFLTIIIIIMNQLLLYKSLRLKLVPYLRSYSICPYLLKLTLTLLSLALTLEM